MRRHDHCRLLTECGAIDPTTRTVTSLGIWARAEFDRPPAPRVTWADDDVLELRIDLDRFRLPVWRRVRLRADTTLTELHGIIQLLFEWDGDHLHVFTVDGAHYSDAFDMLDDCADSDQLTLAAALPRAGARLAYRYDLGLLGSHRAPRKRWPGRRAEPTHLHQRPRRRPRRGLARRGTPTTPPARSHRARPAPGPTRGQLMTELPGLFDLPDPRTSPARPSRDRGRRSEHWTRTAVADPHVLDSATLRAFPPLHLGELDSGEMHPACHPLVHHQRTASPTAMASSG